MSFREKTIRITLSIILLVIITNATIETTRSQGSIETLPTAYGYYVFDNGQLHELVPENVKTKMGLPAIAMDGFSGEPVLTLQDKNLFFINKQWMSTLFTSVT